MGTQYSCDFRAETWQNQDFSVTNPGLVTSTGWHGAPPPSIARKEIMRRFHTKEIMQDIATFMQVPYVRQPQ
jgi:hypothetical protein